MGIFASTLSTDKGINYTNMALMFISTVLAFILPFQLFLFVYAVIGPLHYLTEISWLDKRSFFVKRKMDVWLFIVPAVLLTYALFNPKSKINQVGAVLILTALVYAFILVLVEKPVLRYALFFISFLVIWGAKIDTNVNLFIAFGVMLPTIIHVYLFTGIFILSGAIKNKSSSAILSLVFFILCTLSFFFLKNVTYNISPGATTQSNMQYFLIINKAIAYIFNADFSSSEYFSHPTAIAIGRFIAFAYTYHYLNWFSKTTVIKWHEVSKNRLFVIGLLWVGAVSAYFINYKLGFDILFLLSMLHVFFEFPLNIQTIKGMVGRGK